MFEQLSGLKINFHKSELFCFGKAKEQETLYSSMFGCKLGVLPFKYLGIPMHHRKLSNRDWKMIEDRFEKRLSSWKGKLLSAGGWLVLISSVLSSLPMFMLSFFEVPRGVLRKMDFYRSRFYWQNDQHRKKYRLAKWDLLCQPKDQGGLGIINLDIQNKCLLSKWLFRLLNEEGMWQQLIRNKYLKNKTLNQVEKRPGDSHFWGGLMGIKNHFLNLGSFALKNGTQVSFWEDTWLGDQPFKYQYPSLYNIVRKNILSSSPLNLSFRRALIGNKLTEWHNLALRMMNFSLTEGKDVFKWKLKSNGSFTVRSMYRYLIINNIRVSPVIWRTKVPLKIKIFMWYLQKGVVLTKDNLIRRNWSGNASCAFCVKTETIQHLFFECHHAKFLWRLCHIALGILPPRGVSDMFGGWVQQGGSTNSLFLLGAAGFCWALWLHRNDVVFEKSRPKSFLQVLFRGIHWIRYWAKLQQNEDQAQLITEGCRRMETLALQLFASHGWSHVARISL